MASQFSFSFSGDDIEDDDQQTPSTKLQPPVNRDTASSSAFPVQGKPLLQAVYHDLDAMLSKLPSKVAFSTLSVDLDGQGTVILPRRELWDVRVQLMAEEDTQEGDAELEPGLGKHDVKTGIYEGGFKSWESSVDLVKVLAAEGVSSWLGRGSCRIIEVRSIIGQDAS
jgi:protein-histidine N-methyltransferase